MGLCFSKKKRTPPPPISPSSNSSAVEKKTGEKKKKKQQQQQQDIEPTTIPSSKSLSGKAAATVAAAAAAATEKKPPVFVIMQNAAKNSAGEKEKKDRPEIESNGGGRIISATAAVDEARPVPVRTSSCTKEEVDAILIQCGRLSRSSSGKAPSSDTTGGGGGGGGHRRFSGSKRSFDFDHEKKLGEEELETGESEKQLSRPSPRRRTPGRDRSGSRERATGGSGGSRRVSRSPSRRSDGPASSSASAGERTKQPPLQQQQQQQQQPAKMVSVPAREKEAGVKRSSPVKPKRCASPRSQSPANSARIGNENAGLNRAPQPGQPQSLSRSSSRKAENSPYRRNPMAEIDDNSLRGANQIGGANNYKVSKSPKKVDDGVRKLNQTQSQKSSENNNVAPRKSEIVEEALEAKESSNSTPNVIFESLNPRAVTQSRSSRRSSRDLDQNLGYTSLLLEDIQNYYHHQHNNAAFSLPACVSKACSILEAVADLNSSSTENGRFGKRGGSVAREPILESEILVKDDLMEPTLHKYVSVRDLGGGGVGVGGGGEMEPQESAGSNSFLGQPWPASSWEPNSVDSTDQYSASQSINGEEEVEQENGVNAGGRRSRGGSTNGSNIVVAVNTSRKKREIGGDHQQQQQQQRRLYRGGSSVSARSGTRAPSVPVTAAAAAAQSSS